MNRRLTDGNHIHEKKIKSDSHWLQLNRNHTVMHPPLFSIEQAYTGTARKRSSNEKLCTLSSLLTATTTPCSPRTLANAYCRFVKSSSDMPYEREPAVSFVNFS